MIKNIFGMNRYKEKGRKQTACMLPYDRVSSLFI